MLAFYPRRDFTSLLTHLQPFFHALRAGKYLVIGEGEGEGEGGGIRVEVANMNTALAVPTGLTTFEFDSIEAERKYSSAC